MDWKELKSFIKKERGIEGKEGLEEDELIGERNHCQLMCNLLSLFMRLT